MCVCCRFIGLVENQFYALEHLPHHLKRNCMITDSTPFQRSQFEFIEIRSTTTQILCEPIRKVFEIHIKCFFFFL